MAKKENSILTPRQRDFLRLIQQERYFTQRFYFTGGTALAEFYLQHRISEDLDFFSEKKEINPIPISQFIGAKSEILGLEKFETKRVLGLYSFFLHFKDKEVLKVDFNYYPFLRIEKGIKFGNLQINSIYDIAVDKVHTISMKPRARDFIDIYFIIKEKGYILYKLLMDAKAKFDWDINPIELGSRLLEATKVSDYPRMLKKVNHNQWKRFFVEEAKKLKKEIFI